MPFETVNWRRVFVVLLVLVLGALSFIALDQLMRARATQEAGSLARNDAEVLSSGLQSELDKFNLLPLVLAEDPQVQALLSGRQNNAETLNLRLEALAKQTNAAAIYLMNGNGDTLASSNWRLPTSFVGSNYRFRGYFQNAIEEGSASQFALGTVSREPGLYVAQRVGSAGNPSGIVAVKVEFDRLEATWRDATRGVYVTDRDGVVLLASQEDWRFKLTDDGMAQDRDARADERQFGIAVLAPLNVQSVMRKGQIATAPLIETQQPIALDGWVLHLLIDPSPRIAATIANGRLFLLAAFALLVGLFVAAQYFRRQRKLAGEIALNEKTRNLREQLTQANRLATLGQISAGVAHEISQPVAAAQVFAENGSKLIAAGSNETASDNFSKIVTLTQKIGLITAELRNFSRKQVSEPKILKIGQAVDGALLLLGDRIDSLDAELELPSPDELAINVRAEHVRLEQVLVNLLQNALDATGEQGQIELSIRLEGEYCFLQICDNGGGVAAELSERLFEPFATNKPNGLGLGLVISRDIMRDLGGDLTFTNSQDGACFSMSILRA